MTRAVRSTRWSALTLAVVLLGLALWRARCVVAGPDQDTDAYAHHMIARAILADPRDLAVHWVWLPLFHYIQVPLVVLGGTMEFVRWTNVVLGSVPPLMLFAYVRATARTGTARIPSDAVALAAALWAAICPIAMQMGTTAEPEPLFAALILAAAIAFEKRWTAATTASLALAVMLRYEAWAALAVVAAVLAWETWRGTVRGVLAWTPVVVSVVIILSWAALRRPVDGRWFGFLAQTREFANGALHERSSLDHGLKGLAIDLAYYPIVVPWKVIGSALPFVPFGIVRSLRQQGARFVLVLGACLGAITLSWIQRSSLGLDRHFVVVVPLYATLAAQGLATVGDGAQALLRRSSISIAFGRAVFCVLGVAALGVLAVALVRWMDIWRASVARGWPERERLGAYLRSLPADGTIFCDDSTFEILSGVDRGRFDRHWTDDPHTWELIAASARQKGVAYVATWREKFAGHENLGSVVFATGEDPSRPTTTGIAVMRVGSESTHPRH
jgi:hypothetical protein